MSDKKPTISIVGSGVSGLVAALVLEKHGYSPVIYEAAPEVGGRVRTDVVDGYQLDHGFQVLLSAYPMAKKYLDYAALDLQKLAPGAVLFSEGKQHVLGDPLRNLSFLIPTLSSAMATISDKLRIVKLQRELKKKSMDSVFNTPETTTMKYLKEKGFSQKVIRNFFTPFFSGIFLEPNLETSSRMFEFVYKMFGEGYAVLPKSGIGAIPKQLESQLKTTKIQVRTAVKNVNGKEITLSNGTQIISDYVVVAAEASSIISNLKNQEVEWRSCDTLYFEVPKRVINKAIIGLITDDNRLINNIFYHTTVETESKGTNELLSVTVVKSHQLSESELQKRVVQELAECCHITDATFIKQYTIKKALPKLKQLQGSMLPTETQLTEHVFLAGDQLLNGSLQAAMLSGERAALGVLGAISGTVSL